MYYYFKQAFHTRSSSTKTNRMGTGYSTYGRHFITVKGEVIAQCCQSTVEEPTLKIKGKIILKPNSISAVAVRTPKITDTEVDILHRVDHKIPRELNIHILNTGNNSISLGKNTHIGSLKRSARVESIFNIDWYILC